MNNRAKLIALTLICLLLTGGNAQAVVGSIVVAMGRTPDSQPINVDFSADAMIEAKGIKMNTKIHYQKDKLRDEATIEGQNIVIIQRYDLGKTWMLMGPGMYMEYDIGKADQAPDYALLQKEEIGTETVNGIETTKYKTLYENAEGKFGGFTWVNAENIAVKGELFAESDDRREELSFELSNLKLGSQPAELFELPAGASKLDLGGINNMMKGMQNQFGQ